MAWWQIPFAVFIRIAKDLFGLEQKAVSTGLTEGILRRMIDELGETPKVIATGGFAKLIAENCDLIDAVDENLMLEGLRLIYEKTKN